MIDILILLGLVILVGGVFAELLIIYIIEKYKKPWLKYLITLKLLHHFLFKLGW